MSYETKLHLPSYKILFDTKTKCGQDRENFTRRNLKTPQILISKKCSNSHKTCMTENCLVTGSRDLLVHKARQG